MRRDYQNGVWVVWTGVCGRGENLKPKAATKPASRTSDKVVCQLCGQCNIGGGSFAFNRHDYF